MKASDCEVKIDLCPEHKNINLSDYYPGYVFSELIFFPVRKCRMPECGTDAYHTLVGIKVPTVVGETIKRENDEKLCRGTYEIFLEAKELMDGVPALEGLCYFLRTRIIPSHHRQFLAKKLIRQFGEMVLFKLKIDPSCSLSDKDKHRILQELKLYPEDYES